MMREMFVMALAVLCLGAGITVALNVNELMAQDMPDIARSITVRGESRLDVAPDQATVDFSIVTKGKDPNLARQLNAEASKRTLKAIDEIGVPSKAVRLQNLVLNQDRRWNPDTREYEELGYEVTRSVQVTLEDLDKVADVVTKVVALGANRLSGVRYGLQSDTEVRTRALTEAVLSAKSRAHAMVAALDNELGQVLTIKEEGLVTPTRFVQVESMQMQKGVMSDESGALPEGDISVSATVVVTFAIK